MAETIFAHVTGNGPGTGTLVNVIIKWSLSHPVSSHYGGELAFAVDTNDSIGVIRQSLRDQLSGYVSALTGVAFTANDVEGVDELIAQQFGYMPISVTMSSLIAADDICKVTVPSILGGADVVIDEIPWSGSARALISGTATLEVKNGAGTIIASHAITEPGAFMFTPTVSTIAADEVLRFGFSGVGTGLSDVSVTAWLKLPLGV